MAKTLHERCNDNYLWAVWIMYVGFIDPNDWPLIDTEFKLINNNVSLKDHILVIGLSTFESQYDRSGWMVISILKYFSE